MPKNRRQKSGSVSKAGRPGTATARPVTPSIRPPANGTEARRPVVPPPPPSRPPSRPPWQRWPWLLPAVVAAIVVVVIAVAAYVLVVRAGPTTGAPLGEQIADEGREHVAEGTPIHYKNTPPASGPHYPSPKPWGFYDEAVAPGYWVHNLEHGGVVVLYDCPSGCPEIVNLLRDATQTFPKEKYGEVKLLVTPYSELPDNAKVAALSWDWRQIYHDNFSRDNLLAFYTAHVDRGPEDIP